MKNILEEEEGNNKSRKNCHTISEAYEFWRFVFSFWKEKRNEYKQLKPKCINCKRPVGTIFSIKHSGNQNDDFRMLMEKTLDVTEDKKDPKIIYVIKDNKTYISPFISLHHTKDYLSRLGITESFKHDPR
jgi:hypothetical protein